MKMEGILMISYSRMRKRHLVTRYIALHDELEREITHFPETMTVKELRAANKEMTERLAGCPT